LSHALVTNRYQRRARRRLKNFSRNRPETTNLNHQYAIRRVDIYRILDAPSGPASWIAPKPEAGCDMVHIGGRKRRRDGWGKFALIAESFAARLRYSGASLGHRLGSHPPAPEARRRRSQRGCPAPVTHPIAIDIAICAVTSLAATATMTEGHFRRNQSR
jgi:hypothetical protein